MNRETIPSCSKFRCLFLSFVSTFLVLVVCLVSLYAFFRRNPIARIPNVAPVGKLPDGYEWQFEDGADFYVYRAQRLDSDSSGIGIYFGNMPSFSLPDGTSSEDFPHQYGRVASQDVSWVVLDGKEDITAHSFYRTTIFEYQYSIYMPLKLHIWVYAEEQDELEYLLHSLENLRIRKKN